MDKETEYVKCLIIGSGPAGYTAAIYAARSGLNPVLYTGAMEGGQLTMTTEVENFPGYPEGVLGKDMMLDFYKQASRLGTDIRRGYITSVDFTERPYKVVVDEETTIVAETVIVSTGASAKWLGLESEQRYNGFGVSACAVCDGFFFKGQDIAIVGAGDTAAEEASYLAKLARTVYMIVRRGEFRASKAMVDRVINTPNIKVLYHTETREILADGFNVTGVRLFNNKSNEEKEIPVSGFFVAIGRHPNTEIFRGWLEMDKNGYILTRPGSTQTNLEGVYCCGDAQDPMYRQAITAAASGCMAAIDAERYLSAKQEYALSA